MNRIWTQGNGLEFCVGRGGGVVKVKRSSRWIRFWRSEDATTMRNEDYIFLTTKCHFCRVFPQEVAFVFLMCATFCLLKNFVVSDLSSWLSTRDDYTHYEEEGISLMRFTLCMMTLLNKLDRNRFLLVFERIFERSFERIST